jgi:drug/metabolite transporter (DMT)-like permease
MSQIYAAFVLAVLGFGAYPLIVKSAGTVGLAGPFVLVVASLIPICLLVGYYSPSFSLPGSAWLRLGSAGILMGIAFLAFTFLLGQPQLHASRTIPIVSTATLLIGVAGGQWFFAEGMTTQKFIGVVAAVIAIILLRPPIE